MRKIIYLNFIILFLTGCSMSYEITIDDKIIENVEFSESISIIKSFDNVDDYLSSELKLVKENNKYNDYIISTEFTDDSVIGVGEKSYSNFNNFKDKSTIFNEIFSDASFSINKGINYISMNTNDLSTYFDDNLFYDSFVDELKIKINVPGKIINGNYDYVLNNTAVWVLDSNKSICNLELNYKIKKDFLLINIVLGIIIFIMIYILFTYLKYKKERRIL